MMRLTILLLLLPTLLMAQRSKVKDQRFVWADSGLVMRAEGSASGEKVLTIPYGAVVTLLGERAESLALALFPDRIIGGKAYNGWTYNGEYVAVSHAGVTGFVHEAYLSRWSPNFFAREDGDFYKWTDLNADSIFVDEVHGSWVFNTQSRTYAYGLTISEYQTDGGIGGTIVLPNTTLLEGFHFARKYFDFSQSNLLPTEDSLVVSSSDRSGIYFLWEILQGSIIQVGSAVVISWDSSC